MTIAGRSSHLLTLCRAYAIQERRTAVIELMHSPPESS